MSRIVVIGAGLAGLVAANRLADAGAEVTLVAKGIGGLQLGQGTIDLLGYAPQRVTNPLQAIDELVKSSPSGQPHPYALIGTEGLRASVEYLKGLVSQDLLVGDVEANYQLPTAVGAIRPTCLAQPSMVAGHVRDQMSLAIVGIRRLKDFPAPLVAANLDRTKLPDGGQLSARPVWVDVPARDEVDSTGLVYATAFDDQAFRERFAETLKPLLNEGEIAGLPAVLGLKDARAWSKLADALGHPVFEIPLPPPSIPGMRINQALSERAVKAGVVMIPGSRTVGFRAETGRVAAVSVATAGAHREFSADAFVLATGGFESGALAVDSYQNVTETLFRLPLANLTETPLIHGDYWGAEQPLFRVGVAVDQHMRALGSNGEPVYSNLRATGGILAGASRWAEKSGDGIAVGSALRAADSILEELS